MLPIIGGLGGGRNETTDFPGLPTRVSCAAVAEILPDRAWLRILSAVVAAIPAWLPVEMFHPLLGRDRRRDEGDHSGHFPRQSLNPRYHEAPPPMKKNSER